MQAPCVLQVIFVLIDVDNGDFQNVLNFFGVKSEDAPTVHLINTKTEKKYAMPDREITTENVRQFCQDVLDGAQQVSQLTAAEEEAIVFIIAIYIFFYCKL